MKKKDSQDGGYLQVTLIPSTKFRVKWLFGSGEEEQNRFPR